MAHYMSMQAVRFRSTNDYERFQMLFKEAIKAASMIPGALIFHAGDCDQDAKRAADDQSAKIGKGEGTIGQVWQSGVPAIRASDSNDSSSAALNAMVALPIMDDRGLKAIVAWHF